MVNISIVEIIYGSPTPILQEKLTRVEPKGAMIEIIPLPMPKYQHHEDLQLYIELFFVNGYSFLEAKTNKVYFITAKI